MSPDPDLFVQNAPFGSRGLVPFAQNVRIAAKPT